MLARWRHRTMAVAAAAIAALCWLAVLDLLRPESLAQGLVLSWSRQGMVQAALLVVAAGIPAIILSLLISAAGFSMTGLLVFTGGLTILAAQGGPMTDWLHTADRNGGYASLIIELFFWQAFLALVIFLIHKLRQPIHAKLPALIIHHDVRSNPSLNLNDANTLAAGGLCAAIAGVLIFILVRSPDGSQVIWSLLVIFALAGFIARLVFPAVSVLGILFSPALVAMAAYVYMLVTIENQNQLETLLNTGQLPGPALALPIHYTSAAVTGCALGIGWAGNSESGYQKQSHKPAKPATTGHQT